MTAHPAGPSQATHMVASELDRFFTAYVECALWSSTDESRDDGGDPLDANYGASDIDETTWQHMASECEAFFRANYVEIGTVGAKQAGHDFWLTRNGHGSGFWDGDWPEPAASRLTKAAHKFGKVWLTVGDDGRIYQ